MGILKKDIENAEKGCSYYFNGVLHPKNCGIEENSICDRCEGKVEALKFAEKRFEEFIAKLEDKLSPEFDDMIKTLRFPDKFFNHLDNIMKQEKEIGIKEGKHLAYEEFGELDKVMLIKEHEIKMEAQKKKDFEEFEMIINDWLKQYPEDIFKKPDVTDYSIIHSELKKSGLTLDIFSADIYRRVLEELKKQISGEGK